MPETMIIQREVEESGFFRSSFQLYFRLEEETLSSSYLSERNKTLHSPGDSKTADFSTVYSRFNERLKEETLSDGRGDRRLGSGAPKTVKKVHFDIQDNGNTSKNLKVQVMGPLLKPSSEMTESEKNDVWWQASDYTCFTREIGEIARKNFHQGTAGRSSSYSETLKRTYQACCSKPKHTTYKAIIGNTTRKQLEQWTSTSVSSRGLEYVSVPFLVAARRRNRESCVPTLVALQNKMHETKVYDVKMMADTLCAFSERKSQSARLFAHVMGEADAAAVRESTSV